MSDLATLVATYLPANPLFQTEVCYAVYKQFVFEDDSGPVNIGDLATLVAKYLPANPIHQAEVCYIVYMRLVFGRLQGGIIG